MLEFLVFDNWWLFPTIFTVVITVLFVSIGHIYHFITASDSDVMYQVLNVVLFTICLLYTSPSPRDGLLYRMPSSA